MTEQMTREEFEELLPDFVDGQLSVVEEQRFTEAAAKDPALGSLLTEYQEIMRSEEMLRATHFDPPPSFDVQVADRIEAVRPAGFEKVFSMFSSSRLRLYAGAAATCATLVLALKFAVDPNSHIPSAPPPGARVALPSMQPSPLEATPAPTGAPTGAIGTPVPEATLVPPLGAVASQPQPATVALPPGFRAATIETSPVTGVEGAARPGSKVDVILTYQDPNATAPRSVVITSGATVLSPATETAPYNPSRRQAGQTVTLSVPATEALKLSTAQSIGTLSLALQGATDEQRPAGAASAGTSLSTADLVASRQRVEANEKEKFRAVAGYASAPKPASNPTEKNGVAAEYQSRSFGQAADGAPVPPPLDDASRMTDPRWERQRVATSYPGNKTYPAKKAEDRRAVAPPPPQPRYPSVPSSSAYASLRGTPAAESAEQYIAYEENPRVSTTQEPMSTFGVDVDTASYANVRRFLQSGQLPPPASVRIEELLNYFSYDYPTERDRPFGLTYEIAPSPLEPGRHLLRMALKSRQVTEQKKPWNLVFLIDVSGSMAPVNRLPMIKSALRALVERMSEADQIAIVTYAGDSRIALQSTSVNYRERILAAIDTLTAGGSTNGASGIRQAYELASRTFINGGVNRVVLATDGDFNVGVTSHSELVSMIEEKRRAGVNLTVLGVGNGNLHDGTLEQIANKGDGNYFYLDSLQEARRVLEQNLTSTMEVVAKDVKLQVEFNPKYVSQYRLIGYDNRKLANHEFNNDAVDSGEIGSGHAVTALYEVTLTDSPLAAGDVQYRYRDQAAAPPPAPAVESEGREGELGFLKIRYKAPERSQSELLEFPLARSAVRNTTGESTNDFRFAAAVAYFGELLRNSAFKGSYSYNDIAALAESARGSDADGKRREFVELVRNAAIGGR